MKAGIVLDDWKLPVFRKRLTDAGFTYTDAGGVLPDTTLLTVETNDVTALAGVVKVCQAECARTGKPRG